MNKNGYSAQTISVIKRDIITRARGNKVYAAHIISP